MSKCNECDCNLKTVNNANINMRNVEIFCNVNKYSSFIKSNKANIYLELFLTATSLSILTYYSYKYKNNHLKIHRYN